MKTFAPTQAEINTECRKYLDILNFYANSNFKDFKNIYFMFLVQKERLSGVFRAASLVLKGKEKAEYLLRVVSFYEQVESVCVEHLVNLVTARGKPTKAMAKTFKELHKEAKGKAYGIRNASVNINKEETDAIIAKLFSDNKGLNKGLKERDITFSGLDCRYKNLECEHANLEDEHKKLINKHNKILEAIQQNLALTNEEFVLICKKKHAVLGTKQANEARRMYLEEGLTPEQIAGIMEVNLKTIVDALEYRTY